MWPTYLHLAVGGVAAFCGGVTVKAVGGPSIPVACTAAAIWAAAWSSARRRRSRIIRPLAAAGQARIRRRKTYWAAAGWLVAAAAGVGIIVGTQPVNETHVRRYLRTQACNDDRPQPFGTLLSAPTQYDTVEVPPAIPARSARMPSGSIVRVPSSPAVTIRVPRVADPKYAEPVISQDDVDAELALWRYAVTLSALTIVGATIAFVAALAEYWRVRI